jgi:methylisocitrate lyase
MVLYPLSVNRAMNQSALHVLEHIRRYGTQKGMLEHMQTRDELYAFLNYFAAEEKSK